MRSENRKKDTNLNIMSNAEDSDYAGTYRRQYGLFFTKETDLFSSTFIYSPTKEVSAEISGWQCTLFFHDFFLK